MKKAALFSAFLLLLFGSIAFYDDAVVLYYQHQTTDKLYELCDKYGFKNTEIRVQRSEIALSEKFVAFITAESVIDDSDKKLFDFFREAEELADEYYKLMIKKNYKPRVYDVRYNFNDSSYTCSYGIIRRDGNAVQYETIDIRLRDTHKDKVPYVGMPKRAVDMTKYGYSYTDTLLQKKCWRQGNYKYYFEISDDEKQFDGFSDKYITKIESVYIPPTTAQTTTKKRHSYKKSTKPSDDDPYDVDSYYHPEDFYYDHYDDFFDYYDAEDYFYEHAD
ncbi:MAG: hypothetical protein IJB86_00120 [Clostridia bacterium]|nr:hypothetical protein [Clostridia bacterium]